jgi:hypothetical protein
MRVSGLGKRDDASTGQLSQYTYRGSREHVPEPPVCLPPEGFLVSQRLFGFAFFSLVFLLALLPLLLRAILSGP